MHFSGCPLIFQNVDLTELAPWSCFSKHSAWLPRFHRAGPSTSLDKSCHLGLFDCRKIIPQKRSSFKGYFLLQGILVNGDVARNAARDVGDEMAGEDDHYQHGHPLVDQFRPVGLLRSGRLARLL